MHKNQDTVLTTQYHEIGTVAQLAATSRIAAPKRNQTWFFDIPWKEEFFEKDFVVNSHDYRLYWLSDQRVRLRLQRDHMH